MSSQPANYTLMSKYQFTDVTKTELFAYSLKAGQEYQLTNLRGRVRSPIFIGQTIIFICEFPKRNSAVVDSSLYGVKFKQRGYSYYFADAVFVSFDNK